MEFDFNVNEILKTPIVTLSQNIIPPDFAGDKRALYNTLEKVTKVINTMGEASATAQNLKVPITTTDRLRRNDQIVYLLVEKDANDGKGAVSGMLKTGSKQLYVYDRNRMYYQVSPRCVLDFYVHESRQRQGLGKQLFEHMLQKEKVEPVKLAVDRPSPPFLSFLKKHYNLNSEIKQMNNYVVFDGFFNDSDAKQVVIDRGPTNGLERKQPRVIKDYVPSDEDEDNKKTAAKTEEQSENTVEVK